MKLDGLRVKYLKEEEKTDEDGETTTYKLQLVGEETSVTISSTSSILEEFSPNEEVLLEVKQAQKKLNDDSGKKGTKA